MDRRFRQIHDVVRTRLLVREASASDLPAILGLYAQPDSRDCEMPALPHAREIFARFRRYPNYHLYVALDGDEIVGSLALLIVDSFARRGARSGVVEDVVVHPERWSEGVGRQMMAFVRERCREARCCVVMLSSNLIRAHPLYESTDAERRGYRFVGSGRAGHPSRSGEVVQFRRALRGAGASAPTRI